VRVAEDPGLSGRWVPDGVVNAEQAALRAAWRRAPEG